MKSLFFPIKVMALAGEKSKFSFGGGPSFTHIKHLDYEPIRRTTVDIFESEGQKYIVKIMSLFKESCPRNLSIGFVANRRAHFGGRDKHFIFPHKQVIWVGKCATITEYVEGEDLVQFSNTYFSDLDNCILGDLFRKLAEIIRELHQKEFEGEKKERFQGIAHCDIKPDNIIIQNVGKDNYIMTLIDFGNAVDRENFSKFKNDLTFFPTREFQPEEKNFPTFDDLLRGDLCSLGKTMERIFRNRPIELMQGKDPECREMGKELVKLWRELKIFTIPLTAEKCYTRLADLCGKYCKTRVSKEPTMELTP